MKRLALLLSVWLVASPSAWASRWLLGDYLPVTKNENTTDAQTDTTLWDPDAEFRFVLQGCFVSADATQTVEFEVSDVDVIPPVYLAANTSVLIGGGSAPIALGAVDAILKYTTTTSANTTVLCWGWQDQI